MENLRSFTVTCLPWTNKKPARVKIYDNRNRKGKEIGYHNGSGKYSAHEEIAAEYLESIGIKIIYLSQGKKGFILLTRNFETELK